MDFGNLTPEQQEKAQTPRTIDEPGMAVAEEERELSDEQLEAVVGGWLGTDTPLDRYLSDQRARHFMS